MTFENVASLVERPKTGWAGWTGFINFLKPTWSTTLVLVIVGLIILLLVSSAIWNNSCKPLSSLTSRWLWYSSNKYFYQLTKQQIYRLYQKGILLSLVSTDLTSNMKRCTQICKEGIKIARQSSRRNQLNLIIIFHFQLNFDFSLHLNISSRFLFGTPHKLFCT